MIYGSSLWWERGLGGLLSEYSGVVSTFKWGREEKFLLLTNLALIIL